MSSLHLYPLALFISEVTISAITIGYTSATSMVRLALLPLILCCTYLCVSMALEQTQRVFWATLYGGISSGWAIHYIEIALLSRWSYESRGPSPRYTQQLKSSGRDRRERVANADTGGFLERLRYGYLVTFSFRNCGTPYEVKNVPYFSQQDPEYIPTRWTFLRHTAVSAHTCYLFIDLSSHGTQPDQNPILYSSQNVPFFARLHEISCEELVIRIITTIGMWTATYCLVKLYQDVSAFVCVISGLNDVRSWRPAYGSLREAYSLRRFWRYDKLFTVLLQLSSEKIGRWLTSSAVCFGTNILVKS